MKTIILASARDTAPHVAGSSVGQDLNLSLERVTASRNFTNKLWNAGKFVLFNLDKVRQPGWGAAQGGDGDKVLSVKGNENKND